LPPPVQQNPPPENRAGCSGGAEADFCNARGGKRVTVGDMIRELSILLAIAATGLPCAGRENYREFAEAPHDYWTRPLRDRFTTAKAALESGALALDRSSEKAFVESLLRALEVPVSSQLLVFSTTSLQLSRIS